MGVEMSETRENVATGASNEFKVALVKKGRLFSFIRSFLVIMLQ